ncbi:MAG: SurA N-terminal domain-containing protein [Clostridia bacterium]|nr:SurA N-terminal domain-containing protein [Clostridia bacterium]
MKRFISAILVTIIALISLSGCLGKGGDYVAEIGNTKISRGEFMVYLIEQKKNFEEQGGSDIWEADFDGVSAIEVAKQNALDSITMVKSAVKQTDSLGIKLDEKDISDIDNQTKSLMSEFSSEELTELSLDYDKIHSILEESALQSKVYDYVTSNYVVNSDEMNKYIEEYKKKNAGEFNTYTVQELFVQGDVEGSNQNYTKAQDAYNKIKNGADFSSVAKEISPDLDTNSKTLDIILYGEDVLQAIYKTAKGNVTFISATDGYYIFKVNDIAPTDNADKIKELENQYTESKKQQIYQAQIKQWSGNTSVKKNEDVWNSITSF